ncbi:hypothetical protein [Microbacterium hydrocarbonoxydans]|uniref:hypothetical protein n=1 Tax=Microbacterium hydrocarbonoxydans TaxID=273678 RepID=UPI00203E46EE|nr:hypothetical protein [Microbacterium hydrocarbonoxydans]MCM3778582.1 hypothetical protein [Microbacterium hydrocarbonoxydans]
MTDADAELRALQSRAYGRDADIARDPEAMRRLADLEAPQPVEPSVAVVPPSATPVSASEAAPSTAAESIEPEAEPRLGFFDPRPRAAWIAVACAAVAVVAAVSASVATAVTAAARPVEPGLVDTIAVDPGADWWDALGERTDGSVLFEDWYGLTFVRNEGWSEIDDQRCLLGVPTETVRSASNGFTAIGMECSAGAFPASLQIIVDAGQPDALRDRFPEGAALKFTLRGDTVEVRADSQDG